MENNILGIRSTVVGVECTLDVVGYTYMYALKPLISSIVLVCMFVTIVLLYYLSVCAIT